MDAPAALPLWPWWQRLLHWLLATAIITALITHEGGKVHEAAGYVALAVAMARITLGFRGPPVGRFSGFVQGWAATIGYAKLVLQKAEPRHLNHNPLGAWMVVALLVLATLGGASGWLYTTDRFWGEAWVINLHAASCWAFVGLVPLHIAGVIHAGMRHRENLVAAMLHGRKKPAP